MSIPKIPKENLVCCNGKKYKVSYFGYDDIEKHYDYVIYDNNDLWVDVNTDEYEKVEKEFRDKVIDKHEVLQRLVNNFDKTSY